MTGLRRLAGLSQFHERPDLIAWAQTPAGRLTVGVVASLLLLVPLNRSVLMPLCVGLSILLPEKRKIILLLFSPLVALQLVTKRLPELLQSPDLPDTLAAVVPAVLLVLAFVFLSILAAKNFQRLPSPVRRHPVFTLHAINWIIIAILWATPPADFQPSGWRVVTLTLGLVPFLLWRFCYIILSGQRGSAKNSSYADHVLYALPVFGGSAVPFGKGFDYLRRCWAGDREALARSQLAGLKLLCLAVVLAVVWRLMLAFVHGINLGLIKTASEHGLEIYNLGLPQMQALIAARAAGTPLDASLFETWISLFLALIDQVLAIAISGHAIIGVLRLLGFNAFRNTYKPLLAESIVEFWNRFYYYFKELLVEFFFYPVYTRYFKSRQTLRIFAAVMAAAFLGNSYYHLLRDFEVYQVLSLEEALAAAASRLFYTFLLGLGVFVSMMRDQRRRACSPSESPNGLAFLHRLRRIAGVWLFFALIEIWNTHIPVAEFGVRTAFFFSLFGIEIGP